MSGDSYEDRIALAEASIEQTLDPGAAARREEDDRQKRVAEDQRRAYLIQMMTHPVGRVWLREVLVEMCHTFETRFASVNGMAENMAGTWMFAGEQRIGWKLWEQLDAADPVQASRLRRGA